MVKIYGGCSITIPDDVDPTTGKPYLRLDFLDGTVVHVTANLGDMIAGAAIGARKRFEDLSRARASKAGTN